VAYFLREGVCAVRKYVLIIVPLLLLVLGSTLSCASAGNAEQLNKLQVQVDALNNSLYSTQQQLAETRQALSDAQEQTRQLQNQLQQSSTPSYSTNAYPQYPDTSVTVISQPYCWLPYAPDYRRFHRPQPWPPGPNPWPPGSYPHHPHP
jgi:hypothetical protein